MMKLPSFSILLGIAFLARRMSAYGPGVPSTDAPSSSD